MRKLMYLLEYLKNKSNRKCPSTKTCNCCGNKYNSTEKPGAIMFSSPLDEQHIVGKHAAQYNICQECEIRIVKGFKVL